MRHGRARDGWALRKGEISCLTVTQNYLCTHTTLSTQRPRRGPVVRAPWRLALHAFRAVSCCLSASHRSSATACGCRAPRQLSRACHTACPRPHPLHIWPLSAHLSCIAGTSQLYSRHQQIFALEKSISGCDSINFLSMSCLDCSSAVGFPAAFCRWSYIIFSTVCRVSPSRSDSFEFSGSTWWEGRGRVRGQLGEEGGA